MDNQGKQTVQVYPNNTFGAGTASTSLPTVSPLVSFSPTQSTIGGHNPTNITMPQANIQDIIINIYNPLVEENIDNRIKKQSILSKLKFYWDKFIKIINDIKVVIWLKGLIGIF